MVRCKSEFMCWVKVLKTSLGLAEQRRGDKLLTNQSGEVRQFIPFRTINRTTRTDFF